MVARGYDVVLSFFVIIGDKVYFTLEFDFVDGSESVTYYLASASGYLACLTEKVATFGFHLVFA